MDGVCACEVQRSQFLDLGGIAKIVRHGRWQQYASRMGAKQQLAGAA